MSAKSPRLACKRILIIEHTLLIAILIEDIVCECGFEVAGHAGDIESARAAV